MSEQSSAQLQSALSIPEKIPMRQFAQVLRRCAIALRNRDSSPFTEDDIQLMIEQFELTTNEFDAMFSACVYVLQQSACFSFNSEKATAYAQQCGASEDVAGVFGAVWDAEGDELIESLKQRTITDITLDRTSWRLDLKAAQKDSGPARDPLLLLDLSVNGEDKPITIQFDHASLSKLYQEIEQIQQQIDSLT